MDGIIQRLGFTEIIQHLEDYNDTYKPHWIRIEKNFAQIWMVQATTKRVLPIIGVDQLRNKIMRISALKAHFEAGRIIMVKGHHQLSELKHEYLSYNEEPSNASRHDDGLDALAGLVEYNIAHLKGSQMKFYTGN